MQKSIAVYELKEILERFYREYDFKGRLSHDPIKFPHQYKNHSDIEVSGFIASCLAYGKVTLFMPVVDKILSAMGKSPYDFLSDFNIKKHRKIFAGIKYRFNDNDDIICLLYVLSIVLKRFKSIEALFKLRYSDTAKNIESGLTGLIDALLNIDTSPVYNENIRTRGFLQFFPSPIKGSACKRMNLFLRWMIRDKDIDFGIWKGIPKDKLIIPLDTHIARISRCLGFTERSSGDWKTAVQITEALKKLDPLDPLKYDFALCHHGISKVCSKANCGNCSLLLSKN